MPPHRATSAAPYYKIGELSERTGLTVRALHHYDRIGLLSPTLRSDGGARRYGQADLIRLHRIQTLKEFGYGLADIRSTLDQEGDAPQQLLERQIAHLEQQASKAQALSRRLRQLQRMLAVGTVTGAADWLDLLEMMNMYHQNLNADELKTLIRPGPEALQQRNHQWEELIAEVNLAMQHKLDTASPEVNALAWRWVRLVIAMTDNDPALAGKLRAMHLREPRAQAILGITPAMYAWIAEAIAEARSGLYARHMSPEQAAEVRRRQLATPLDAWPNLMAQWREKMDQGVPVSDPEVQILVQRWQQQWRDSSCGDDPVLQARVYEACQQEPDLRLGVGVDEALMAYVQKAIMLNHPMRRTANAATPKPSALSVALQRAAHQLLEQPPVLDDPLALRIIGAQEAAQLRAELSHYQDSLPRHLRTSVVLRSRVADDAWAAAAARGVRQFVVLGAGLDTAAWRHPQTGHVWEVDLPSTQAWKRDCLRAADLTPPSNLRFVPVDFETSSLAAELAQAGFDRSQPAFFCWLGVSMYLELAAIEDTLRYIASCGPGSAVVFDYAAPLHTLNPMARKAVQLMSEHLAQRGEPWKTYFETAALIEKLQGLGFAQIHSWGPEALNQRYLQGRADGFQVAPGAARLVYACR